eukprot:scaffold1285_cov112-Isochrysis_galbana.AAC.4
MACIRRVRRVGRWLAVAVLGHLHSGHEDVGMRARASEREAPRDACGHQATLELGEDLVPRRVGFLVLTSVASPRAFVPRPLSLPTARAVAGEMRVRAVRDLEDGALLLRDWPMVRGSLGAVESLDVPQEGREGVLDRLHHRLGGLILSLRAALDRGEALRQVAHRRVARARGVQHESSLLQPLRDDLRPLARQQPSDQRQLRQEASFSDGALVGQPVGRDRQPDEASGSSQLRVIDAARRAVGNQQLGDPGSFSSLSSSTHWPKPRVRSRVPATASSRRTTARVARTGVESSGRGAAGSAPAPSTAASSAMPRSRLRARACRRCRFLSEGPGGFPAINLVSFERSNANKNTNKKSFLVAPKGVPVNTRAAVAERSSDAAFDRGSASRALRFRWKTAMPLNAASGRGWTARPCSSRPSGTCVEWRMSSSWIQWRQSLASCPTGTCSSNERSQRSSSRTSCRPQSRTYAAISKRPAECATQRK